MEGAARAKALRWAFGMVMEQKGHWVPVGGQERFGDTSRDQIR